MVREGLFNNVDAVIHWHPGNQNKIIMTSFIANKSAKFKFHGISSHAAMSPENGRSSLDGVEAMNNMANMMREHIPQETRIHYVITKAAEGVALGTGTTMQYEIVGGTHDLLINQTLAELMQQNLEKVGGVAYSEEEKVLGKKITS